MNTMTKGSAFHNIFWFSIPLIVGGVFQQAYNMIDTLIIGRTLGVNEVSGVGSTGVIYFFMTCLVIGICNGGSVVISQYYGVENRKKVNEAIASMAVVLLVLSMLVMGIGACFTNDLVKLMNIPMESADYAKQYLLIVSVFCWGNVLYNGASAVLRSFGHSKTPLYSIIFASIINIILDYYLIVCVGMGVRAAAFATVISQLGSGIWCVAYLLLHRREFGICRKELCISREMILIIVRMGVPTAFQSCMISVGGICVQRLINSFGVDVLAAYTTANKIDNMAIQLICSFGTGLSVYTGQNMGNKNFDSIRNGLRVTMALNIICALSIAALAFLFGSDIMRFFLGNNATSITVHEGTVYLKVMGLAYIICGIMQSYQNVIRGSGDANIGLIAGAAELSGRILFAYLLAYQFGAIGIWIATPLSWGCGCVVPVIRYYTGRWKKQSVLEKM